MSAFQFVLPSPMPRVYAAVGPSPQRMAQARRSLLRSQSIWLPSSSAGALRAESRSGFKLAPRPRADVIWPAVSCSSVGKRSWCCSESDSESVAGRLSDSGTRCLPKPWADRCLRSNMSQSSSSLHGGHFGAVAGAFFGALRGETPQAIPQAPTACLKTDSHLGWEGGRPALTFGHVGCNGHKVLLRLWTVHVSRL